MESSDSVVVVAPRRPLPPTEVELLLKTVMEVGPGRPPPPGLAERLLRTVVQVQPGRAVRPTMAEFLAEPGNAIQLRANDDGTMSLLASLWMSRISASKSRPARSNPRGSQTAMPGVVRAADESAGCGASTEDCGCGCSDNGGGGASAERDCGCADCDEAAGTPPYQATIGGSGQGGRGGLGLPPNVMVASSVSGLPPVEHDPCADVRQRCQELEDCKSQFQQDPVGTLGEENCTLEGEESTDPGCAGWLYGMNCGTYPYCRVCYEWRNCCWGEECCTIPVDGSAPCGNVADAWCKDNGYDCDEDALADCNVIPIGSGGPGGDGDGGDPDREGPGDGDWGDWTDIPATDDDAGTPIPGPPPPKPRSPRSQVCYKFCIAPQQMVYTYCTGRCQSKFNFCRTQLWRSDTACVTELTTCNDACVAALRAFSEACAEICKDRD